MQYIEHTGRICGVQLSVVCTLLNGIIHSRLLWERLVLDLAQRFVSLDVVYVLSIHCGLLPQHHVQIPGSDIRSAALQRVCIIVSVHRQNYV